MCEHGPKLQTALSTTAMTFLVTRVVSLAVNVCHFVTHTLMAAHVVLLQSIIACASHFGVWCRCTAQSEDSRQCSCGMYDAPSSRAETPSSAKVAKQCAKTRLLRSAQVHEQQARTE